MDLPAPTASNGREFEVYDRKLGRVCQEVHETEASALSLLEDLDAVYREPGRFYVRPVDPFSYFD
jgi:hypothetical protein